MSKDKNDSILERYISKKHRKQEAKKLEESYKLGIEYYEKVDGR